MKPTLRLSLLAAIITTTSLAYADGRVRQHRLHGQDAVNATLRSRATRDHWLVLPGQRGPLQVTAQTERNDVRVFMKVKDRRGHLIPVTESKFNRIPGSPLNPGYVAYTGYDLSQKSGPYRVKVKFATPGGKPLPGPARQGIKYWISTEAHP